MPSLAYARDLSRGDYSRSYATDPGNPITNFFNTIGSDIGSGIGSLFQQPGDTNPAQPGFPQNKTTPKKLPPGYKGRGTAQQPFSIPSIVSCKDPGSGENTCGPVNTAACNLLPLPGCASNPKCFGLPVPCWMLAVGGVLVALVLIKH